MVVAVPATSRTRRAPRCGAVAARSNRMRLRSLGSNLAMPGWRRLATTACRDRSKVPMLRLAARGPLRSGHWASTGVRRGQTPHPSGCGVWCGVSRGAGVAAGGAFPADFCASKLSASRAGAGARLWVRGLGGGGGAEGPQSTPGGTREDLLGHFSIAGPGLRGSPLADHLSRSPPDLPAGHGWREGPSPTLPVAPARQLCPAGAGRRRDPRWHRPSGRVVLIGDTIHPLQRFPGSGRR
jgi:hypothetical protein